MNNIELEQALLVCVHREREATVEVLRYLCEVESRGLHLERGFSSMFAYCTKKLGYAEQEAMLRIQAMRLIRVAPEVEQKIESGKMSMTVAAQIQGTVRREKLKVVEAKQLVADLTGASKREAEVKLAALFPEAPKVEKTRAISEELVEIRLTVTKEEAALIQELMDRKAHTNFERSHRKLYVNLVRKELGKTKKDTPPKCPDRVKRTRYIPAVTKRQIQARGQNRCQYQDPLSIQRCETHHGLQIDHIKPYSQGGAHHPQNLRLLCGAHNRLRNKKN